MNDWQIRSARLASLMKVDDAAKIIGLSKQAYIHREKDEGSFRISELLKLYENMNDTGKTVIRHALRHIFFSKNV